MSDLPPAVPAVPWYARCGLCTSKGRSNATARRRAPTKPGALSNRFWMNIRPSLRSGKGYAGDCVRPPACSYQHTCARGPGPNGAWRCMGIRTRRRPARPRSPELVAADHKGQAEKRGPNVRGGADRHKQASSKHGRIGSFFPGCPTFRA